MYGTILGVFDYSEYKSLSVKDRVVVDVGAFVGDSAIYFALRGLGRLLLSNLIQRPIERCLKTSRLISLKM
jgi:hypothetical protein